MLDFSLKISKVEKKITSLKPRAPPPQHQAFPYTSIPKLVQNPQAISLNFGSNYCFRFTFSYCGKYSAFTYYNELSTDLIPSGRSFKPS